MFEIKEEHIDLDKEKEHNLPMMKKVIGNLEVTKDLDYAYWTDHDNILNAEYKISHNGEIKSIELSDGFGGPNTWLDTAKSAYFLAWGGRKFCIYLDTDMCSKIQEYYEEIYYSMHGYPDDQSR